MVPKAQLVVMAVMYVALFLFAWWLGRRSGLEMQRFDHPVAVPPGILYTLAVVPALTAVNYGGTWLLYYPLSLLRPDAVRAWLDRADSLLPQPEGPAETVLLWFVVIILAPVAEELIFRGLLLHRWCRKWGKTRGVLVTTVLFALMHASPLGILLLALGLTAIYLRTGSLRLTMLAHGLNNLLAFLAAPLFALQDRPGQDPLASFQQGLPVSLLLFGCGAVALWLMRDRLLPSPGTPLPYDRSPVTHR